MNHSKRSKKTGISQTSLAKHTIDPGAHSGGERIVGLASSRRHSSNGADTGGPKEERKERDSRQGPRANTFIDSTSSRSASDAKLAGSGSVIREHGIDTVACYPNCSSAADDLQSAMSEAVDAVMAIAMFSEAGVVVQANANYCALFELAPVKIIGRSFQDWIAPNDPMEAGRIWSTVAKGETVTMIRRGFRSNGQELRLESIFRPRLGANYLIDVVEITTDQTDKHQRALNDQNQLMAIDICQAVAYYDVDGIIHHANQLYLDNLGYRLDEIQGRHHNMLVGEIQATSDAYRLFWTELAAGQYKSGEYKYITRDGRPVWLQAIYTPVLDMDGHPSKIVEYSTIVTDQKIRQADCQWQIAAIHRSNPVITFDLNGIILDANELFLKAVDYSLEQIIGHHHRMFVDPSSVYSPDYAAFWRDLAQGEQKSGLYRRFTRSGGEIWLQATYSPISDMDGKPFKIVKYATVVTEERFLQAEHQGQIAAINKAQCVISFDLNGRVLDANDNFLNAMGYRLADVIGCHHRIFVDPLEATSKEYLMLWSKLGEGLYQEGEYRRIKRDGSEIWLQATYNPIFDMCGRAFRIVKYARDVTSERLRRADDKGQIKAISRSNGLISFALDGTILDANEHILNVFGYTLDELKGRHHSILISSADRASPEYKAFWQTLLSGSFTSGLYSRISKDGRPVWIQATYNPIFDLDGLPFKIITFASDVTSQVNLAEAYEDAKRQAQHDSATALPNRVRLATFMSTALAKSDASLVVLYMDLDHFKPINDTFGHTVGDRVLGEVADRLRQNLSEGQLVARVGGDEFVIVAPDLWDEDIEPMCRRIIEAVTAPISHEGHELRVGLSIGVAVSPIDSIVPEDLLRFADLALYRSKNAGRNTFTFYSENMTERISTYHNAVAEIRLAIDRKEFFLEYQPRFKSSSGKVTCFEALLRWQHPNRGRLVAANFIGVAERSGLIGEIGKWVLRTACRAAVTWNGINVSVHVSPVQFLDGDLKNLVRTVLDEEGLPADRLELEITETTIVQDTDHAAVALSDLKAIGVKIAMDNFGTGDSSLSILRKYQFDVIKIDKQFIAELDESRGGRQVVQAILGLGKALGLSVTAEGVETERQLKALAVHQCDELQGYLLGRPMLAEDVADLLRSESRSGESDAFT